MSRSPSLGCIVEVNTRGLYSGKCLDLYPSQWILERMHALDIPITLNSDSHRGEEITAGYAFAARMLTFGATCHFIIPELDAGNQTINQQTFAVTPGTSLDEIIRRGEQVNEPACLVEGVRRVVDREVKLHFHRVVAAT